MYLETPKRISSITKESRTARARICSAERSDLLEGRFRKNLHPHPHQVEPALRARARERRERMLPAPKSEPCKRIVRTTGYRSDGFSGFVNPDRFPVDQSNWRHMFSEKTSFGDKTRDRTLLYLCTVRARPMYSQSEAENARNRMAMWSDFRKLRKHFTGGVIDSYS